MARIPTPEEIDKAINIALARSDFWEYCLYQDIEFFTLRPFLKEIADALQYVYNEYVVGRPRRVSASLPPRAGKSYIASLFCSWWLGKLPDQAVMRNTCTATLYDKFSYDVRSIVRSDKYKEVFPTLELASDKQNLDGWNLSTAKQVSYFGAGMGGTIIGFGANLALSDDLYRSMEDVLSPQYNEKAHRWKQSAHDSRKELNCPEIFIGTRWSVRDVIGVAQQEGKIDKIVTVPALTIDRKSFCEAVKSTAEYLDIEKDMDESIWLAEYMQDPIESKGLLFPLAELQTYNPQTVDPAKLAQYRFCFIDPADEGGDDLSAPAAYLVGDKIYITDVIYNNNGTDVNEPACVEYIVNNQFNAVQVEGNSAWILFAKAVRAKVQERKYNGEVRIMKNTANKNVRILAQSAFIKNHFIFRSDWKDRPEYRKFINNLTQYMRVQDGSGKNKHDDAPDSLAGVATYFRSQMPKLW